VKEEERWCQASRYVVNDRGKHLQPGEASKGIGKVHARGLEIGRVGVSCDHRLFGLVQPCILHCTSLSCNLKQWYMITIIITNSKKQVGRGKNFRASM